MIARTEYETRLWKSENDLPKETARYIPGSDIPPKYQRSNEMRVAQKKILREM